LPEPFLVPAESENPEPEKFKMPQSKNLTSLVPAYVADQISVIASHRGLFVSALLAQVITNFVSSAA
jgi:hypothetical protein